MEKGLRYVNEKAYAKRVATATAKRAKVGDDHTDVVEPSSFKEAIESPEWVYKIKIGADNKIVRFKARWVAKGFAQIPGVDFDQTFSPTAKPTTVRLFFVLVAILGYHCIEADIKLAFWQGEFQNSEVVYMKQPTGLLPGTWSTRSYPKIPSRDLEYEKLPSYPDIRNEAGRPAPAGGSYSPADGGHS